MDSAPPPYSQAVGGNPVAGQNFNQGNLTTQSQVVYVPVILTTQFKMTENDKPYLEYCPVCKCNVTTRTMHVAGPCWTMIMFFSIMFLLLPLLLCLCWNGIKDVRHYCPNCGSLIAYKRRGCS